MRKFLFSKPQSADVAKPASGDIGHTSPFRRLVENVDPVRNGILIGLAIVLLVFLISMIAVLMMHAPSL
jgi:hypothetical protein